MVVFNLTNRPTTHSLKNLHTAHTTPQESKSRHPHHTKPHHTKPHHTKPHHTKPHHTIPHHSQTTLPTLYHPLLTTHTTSPTPHHTAQMDGLLKEALQRDLDSQAPGLHVQSVVVPRPKIPEQIRQSYEFM